MSAVYGDLPCWVVELDPKTGETIDVLAKTFSITVGRGALAGAMELRPRACLMLKEGARIIDRSPAQVEAEAARRHRQMP